MAGEFVELTLKSNGKSLAFVPYKTMDGRFVDIYLDDEKIMQRVDADNLISILNGLK